MMKDIEATIVGTTPLLMCRFTDSAQLSSSSGSRSSVANDSTPAREQAAEYLYTDEDGHVGIPQPNLFRCIVDAGTFFKVGRAKVTTQRTSLIPAALQINPVFLRLEGNQDWKVDTRPVRMPATGGRILRHRPCFEGWGLSFQMSVDESLIGERLLREIVDAAGQRIGLGDFRPATKGPFGRFRVDSWDVHS